MRNSYIGNILGGWLFALTGLTACSDRPAGTKHAHDGHAADSALAVLAKPVNAQVVAAIPAIAPDSGTRIFTAQVNGVVTYDTRRQTGLSSRVGGRIERLLIRYNYQPVKKGQLVMEIYSPELAAAQRELLLVAAGRPEMLDAAKQRLQLLGMQPTQIAQVLRTGSIVYRVPVYSNSDGYILEKTAAAPAAATPAPTAAPAGGDGMGSMGGGSAPATATAPASNTTPLLLREGQYVSAGQSLFTIYQAGSLVAEFSFPPQLAAGVKQGQSLLFYPVNRRNDMQQGRIGLVEPVFRNGQNFTLARVYLGGAGLRAGQLLTASLPLIYRQGWWLPRKAVTRLGNKWVVFRKERDVYIPVEVSAGARLPEAIQVLTDIGGWQVAANAAYLVDSESFIKTANNIQE